MTAQVLGFLKSHQKENQMPFYIAVLLLSYSTGYVCTARRIGKRVYHESELVDDRIAVQPAVYGLHQT